MQVLILFLSYITQLSDGGTLEMHFELAANSYSSGQQLASEKQLSVIRCAAKCSVLEKCAAYNIRDGMCELLPLSVDTLVSNFNSSYYRYKYRKYLVIQISK